MELQLNVLPVVDQSWTISKIAKEAINITWREPFDNAEPELKHITKILDEQKKLGVYYPKKEDLFNAFSYCPLNKVKVVIFGEEPYNTMVKIGDKMMPKDMGLAYSVRKGDEVPKILTNIFLELQREYTDFNIPCHGDLTKWCDQGVLLLNTSLSVSPKMSHTKYQLWYGFLSKVIKSITSKNPNVIFLLWGNTQKMSELITDKFTQLSCRSPSSLSEYEGSFTNCNHFKLVNDHLIKTKQQPIDWQI